MNRTSNRLALAAAALSWLACGGPSVDGDAGLPANLGSVHLRLGAPSVDVTLVVRNVFDHAQAYLVDCVEKDHLLDGQRFCDELLVVPAGIYEIIVESEDDQCQSARDRYQVQVAEGGTAEVEISLVCYVGNGALDVVVVTEYTPSIRELSFSFEPSGAPATKYVCGGGDDVRVEVQVTDSDTLCSGLAFGFSAVDALGADVTSTLLSDLRSVPGDPCRFSALIDASAPLQTYSLTFMVSDGVSPAQAVTFAVHLISCD